MNKMAGASHEIAGAVLLLNMGHYTMLQVYIHTCIIDTKSNTMLPWYIKFDENWIYFLKMETAVPQSRPDVVHMLSNCVVTCDFQQDQKPLW